MTPTTSPGSNQTGDSVTYNAQRISPSGFGWGAAGWKRPSASRAHTSAHPSANFFMPSPPGSFLPHPQPRRQASALNKSDREPPAGSTGYAGVSPNAAVKEPTYEEV